LISALTDVFRASFSEGAEHIGEPTCQRRRMQSHRRPGTEQKPKLLGKRAWERDDEFER
jgi:hypothetical protein